MTDEQRHDASLSQPGRAASSSPAAAAASAKAWCAHFCAQGSRVAFVDMAEEPSQAWSSAIEADGQAAPLFIRLRSEGYRCAAGGDRRRRRSVNGPI